MIYKPGDQVYHGSWVDGKQTGYGILHSSAFSYSGQWLNGKMHGEGIKKGANETSYHGEFMFGKP